MYQKIRKFILKFFNSNSAPPLLYALYFNRRTAKQRRKLLNLLKNNKDLMSLLSDAEKQHWEPRIADVMICNDNKDIPRDPSAGELLGDSLIMHNGIKIDPLSYYNLPMLKMLMDNKGVHEPQEEKIFQEVIKSIVQKESMTMIELGSYWSFYSIWFRKRFSNASSYMAEPNRENLFYGKVNFQMNNLKGKFIHSGIGSHKDEKNYITTVDAICKKEKIEFIDILHSDIQGFELEMLLGSEQMLSEDKVGYVFISTHSNELHYSCLELLKDKYNFSIVASADLDQTYSWDGILVMKSKTYHGLEQVFISKKSKSNA